MLDDNIISKNQGINLEIGSHLRSIRNSYKFTLSEVAIQTNLAEETIRRAETDQFEPKIATLEILSDFYRLDLLELVARSRNSNSLFSEKLISEINRLITQENFVGLKEYLDEKIIELNASKNPNKKLITSLLYSLKYFKHDPKTKQNDTIAIIESFLLELTPDYHSDNCMTYPLPIETSSILFLSVLYRQNLYFDKAIKLLKNTIRRIKNLPFINDRFSDYLVSAYINLAYAYHGKGDDLMVISTVDDCLNFEKVSYTKIAMNNLLFRKGLAQYRLSNPAGIYLLKASIELMKADDRIQLVKVVKEKYNIDLEK